MELEINLSKELMEKVETLAHHLYGHSGPEAINQTICEALSMRMHWIAISSDVATEADEPVAHFVVTGSDGPVRDDLLDMLFREEG